MDKLPAVLSVKRRSVRVFKQALDAAQSNADTFFKRFLVEAAREDHDTMGQLMVDYSNAMAQLRGARHRYEFLLAEIQHIEGQIASHRPEIAQAQRTEQHAFEKEVATARWKGIQADVWPRKDDRVASSVVTDSYAECSEGPARVVYVLLQSQVEPGSLWVADEAAVALVAGSKLRAV